jgi:hypothetical protein
MNTCGLSRLLLVAFVAGWVVSSLTGSELAGWAGVAAAVGAALLARRVRDSAPACPVQPAPVRAVARPPEPPVGLR